MRVETTEDRGVRILSCEGRMMRDGSDEDLIGACDAAIENGGRIVIDLRKTAWMDSSGVGALVACAKHAAERGATIKVALPDDGPVRKVFALCYLERVFDTFRDAAAAVASYLK
jgi:anti-sigma B factor antagonist